MADISRITIGGTTYDIKDDTARQSSGSGTAASTTYDNSDSSLQATNVQDAIDELDALIYDAGNYETVSLTIGSVDSTFSPVGQTITVTLEDGSSTDYVLTNSLVISFSVQKGIKYTISGTSTSDYRVLPLSVKASIPTRYLTMRYIPIATGVFILQKDGTMYLKEEYDAETMAEDTVGVAYISSALLASNKALVLGNDTYVNLAWDATRRGKVSEAYCPFASTDSRKYTLMNGVAATNYLVGLGNMAAAEYCANKYIILNNGKVLNGVLGAPAEHKAFIDNLVEVNACLQIIGFPKKLSAGEWTSWQWDTNSWYQKCATLLTSVESTTLKPVRPIYYYDLS